MKHQFFIIKIDERGFVSCDDLYIFSTDPNFDKVPTTIEKNIKHLVHQKDNTEPEDNPNIKPYVDVEELSNKFSQFDSEESIKQKVKIDFFIIIRKWVHIIYKRYRNNKI